MVKVGPNIANTKSMRRFLILISFILSLSRQGFAAESCEVLVGGSSKQEINVILAKAAGLHYSEGHEAGYSRQIDEHSSFAYFDSSGKPVTDAETLERIHELRIPPAWEGVWISMDPVSHIQARGLDSKGRAQSRYHKVWETEVKDVSKFDRMARFGQAVPHLREVIAHDLQSTFTDERPRIAAVVRLMETAGIRIGGEKYARENEHYGLTTMQVRHVHVAKDTIAFDFVGKEGRAHKIEVQDKAVARLVKKLIAGKADDAAVFEVGGSAVNKYIKENSSHEFSAKDIRTWVGTTAAAKVLIAAGPRPTVKEQEDVETAAAVAASQRLHNEPNTARDNYIDPYLFAAYRTGRLAELAQDRKVRDAAGIEDVVLQLVSEKSARPIIDLD